MKALRRYSTNVYMTCSVMQKSKECWGPDADEFNPDRWFADDITTKEKYWLVVCVAFLPSSLRDEISLTP